MTGWWEKQIDRADQLAVQPNGSRELMVFYAQLLRAQRTIYESLRSRKNWLPSGDLQRDLPIVIDSLPALLRTVEGYGPESLVDEARDLSATSRELIGEMLTSQWKSSMDTQFFPKALLQPYGCWLAETGTTPSSRNFDGGARCCPRCGGKPQVSFLQSKETNSESGNRDLICARCLSSWEFRRVVCANCSEERPAKLGYFHSPEFDHVRIEACDTCGYYIKGVDLTRLGHACPLVDEVATAPLDLWAREHGYKKIELNLVGL